MAIFSGCDQAVFQRDLTYSLKSHPVYRLSEIGEKFVKGLEDHIEDPLRLKWSLLYTQVLWQCAFLLWLVFYSTLRYFDSVLCCDLPRGKIGCHNYRFGCVNKTIFARQSLYSLRFCLIFLWYSSKLSCQCVSAI